MSLCYYCQNGFCGECDSCKEGVGQCSGDCACCSRFINDAFATTKGEKLAAFRLILGLLAETEKRHPGHCHQIMEILMAMHDAIEMLP